MITGLERLVPALEAELAAAPSPERRDAILEELRAAREAWARALAGIAPDAPLVPAVRGALADGLAPAAARAAAAQLHEAERWQWSLGTLATGSGEGLASMAEVRSLQLARAWLLSVDAAKSDDLRDTCLTLAREVQHDTNRLGEALRAHVDALVDVLGAASPP